MSASFTPTFTLGMCAARTACKSDCWTLECLGLENRSPATPGRGFESRPLRSTTAIAPHATGNRADAASPRRPSVVLPHPPDLAWFIHTTVHTEDVEECPFCGLEQPPDDGCGDRDCPYADPFVTSDDVARHASPRQTTRAPITTGIRSERPSGLKALRRPALTGAIYVSYTRRPAHGCRAASDLPAEHCLGCGRRLRLTDPPGRFCATCVEATRDRITHTPRARSRACLHGRRSAMSRYGTHKPPQTKSPLDLIAIAEQIAKANGQQLTTDPPDRTPQIGDGAILDARGYKRPPQTFGDYHRGRAPANKGKEYKPKPPTVAEIMAMLSECGDDVYGRRLYAAIILAWQGALRAFEMLAVTADDLDRESGAIEVRHGKGDKQARIKMAAWAWELLDDWLEIRTSLPNPKGPVICVIDGPTAGRAWSYSDANKSLKQVARAAEVTKRMSWHQLRHAFAAWSFDGTNIFTLMNHLRHSNIGITHVYLMGLGVAESQEEVYTAPVPSIPATALLTLTAAKKKKAVMA